MADIASYLAVAYVVVDDTDLDSAVAGFEEEVLFYYLLALASFALSA